MPADCEAYMAERMRVRNAPLGKRSISKLLQLVRFGVVPVELAHAVLDQNARRSMATLIKGLRHCA